MYVYVFVLRYKVAGEKEVAGGLNILCVKAGVDEGRRRGGGLACRKEEAYGVRARRISPVAQIKFGGKVREVAWQLSSTSFPFAASNEQHQKVKR